MPGPTPLHAGTRRRRALRALIVTGPPVEGPRATHGVAHNGAAERLHGWVLEAPHGHHGLPAAPSRPPSPRIVRVSKRNAQRSRLVPRPVAAQIASAKRAPPASAGEGGREPASGAPAHDVLRPDGGDTVPPESKPVAERPHANLHRRQNCRASPPGGRSAEHPHRRQNCRASPPGGRSAEHPHPAADRPSIPTRRQNGRASPPAADRPSIPTGGRSAEHPHPAADRPSIPTGGRTAEHPHRRQIGRASQRTTSPSTASLGTVGTFYSA
jgi:hypothetical protein